MPTLRVVLGSPVVRLMQRRPLTRSMSSSGQLLASTGMAGCFTLRSHTGALHGGMLLRLVAFYAAHRLTSQAHHEAERSPAALLVLSGG